MKKTYRLVRAQNKQIKRLQERNRLLAECLADERKLRQQAYSFYQKRLQNKFLNLVDLYLLHKDFNGLLK